MQIAPALSQSTESTQSTDARPAGPTPRVWAVGGGKGGVGKSVVTSSLALSLAAGGPRCALVDADLGGANLHTLLGVARPRHTLGDFFSGATPDLADVLAPTSVPGLSLASGARAFLEIANPKHSQKAKLLRHLRRLDVAHVFVDLGAGSSFNVLDPFIAADERVMVVVPEPTSIENAYHFLKAAYFRSLRAVARGDGRAVLEEVMSEGRRRGWSPREMIDRATLRDARVGRELREAARSFAPYLIVNQADTAAHRRVGHEMVAAARRHLGATLRFVGALDLDASVPAAVARQQPVVQLFPGSAFAGGVRATLERMRTGEVLDESSAPASWKVVDDAPPLSTHGISDLPVDAPRLAPVAPEKPPEILPKIDLDWPGRTLRRCREHQGLALDEMKRRTRIRHLEAIEAQRWPDLPLDPYLTSHVRSYAEALGIRAADALAEAYAERAREARSTRPRGLLARLRRAPGIEVLPRRAGS
ncbi:MAG: helix-turn-helix domain-containing protein [Myxococcota bacterium]